MAIKIFKRLGNAGRGDNPHTPYVGETGYRSVGFPFPHVTNPNPNPYQNNKSTGSLPPPSPSDAFSFPKPVSSNRAAPKLTSEEAKALNVGPGIQRFHIDDNKQGAEALTITHHLSNLPPFDSSGRRNQTSPPPANWPTEHQLTMHRIKTQVRSGTNPSDVDVSAIRAGIQKEREDNL